MVRQDDYRETIMTAADAMPEVFISYSSRDMDRVIALAQILEEAGLTVWRDQKRILGGQNFGPEIVAGIKAAKVLLLVCSQASLASKNVKQEIQLAWNYDTPYLPLLLERVSYPEQVEYWLSGTQWIAAFDHPEEIWTPRLLTALRFMLGKAGRASAPPSPTRPEGMLDHLLSMARFGDNLWPARFDPQVGHSSRLRDLGEIPDEVQHRFALGEKIQLRLESDQDGYLTLLDFGPSGTVYCLSPSVFVPDPFIRAGTTILPNPTARITAFTVTGKLGREHLLAIITRQPPPFDWRPAQRLGARKLTPEELTLLVDHLRALPADHWLGFASYFEVTD